MPAKLTVRKSRCFSELLYGCENEETTIKNDMSQWTDVGSSNSSFSSSIGWVRCAAKWKSGWQGCD